SELSPSSPRGHALATSSARAGARSVLRSTATPSRPVEVEAGVEGVAARVVEAERAGAEDLHHQRAGRLGAPEDEALREIHPHVLHLAGDRVRERRELDLERARDAEGAAAAVGRELDRGEDRRLDVGHRAREELEGAAALRLAREDAHQRVALLRRGGLREVEPESPPALMDRLRPGGGIDDVETVEPHAPEAALADVIADQRLAVAVGRVAAEVTRAAEVAVAGLDVVDLQLPARDLLPGLLLRHRPSIRRACAQPPR